VSLIPEGKEFEMSRRYDEENAYRTNEDMAGLAFRRGAKKGLKAVGGAILGGALGGPIGTAVGAALGNLATDAAKEIVTKVIPRSMEDRSDDD
jgi:outer membrane lipoprotein SlyB